MSRLFRGLAAALAIIAFPLVVPETASVPVTRAAATTPVSVTATRHQMRLVMQLRAATYPANALVPVRLRLTNLSTRTVYTDDCLRVSLGADVTGGKGIDLYPDLIPPPGAPWPSCPGEPSMGMGGMNRYRIPIPAGTTLTRWTYVVLRASTVHGWADVVTSPSETRPVEILTSAIHIRETAVSGPTVRINSLRPGVATVRPIANGGPIEYSEWVSCSRQSHPYPISVMASATFSRWMRATGTTIAAVSPPCRKLNEWMLFVAQPGHPIAHAYFCRQHNLCAYAPPTAREVALSSCKRDVARAVTSAKLPASAARYAIGLTSTPPPGLTPAQQALARQFNTRCAPLLKLKP